MKHWTRKRLASFWIHTGVVIVPFAFSTVSAWLFWYSLFQDGVIATSMIVVVDALALLGLILYITRIASPFQVLRHALPFVSIVPLGIELYSVLEPNGQPLAITIALLATAIMVTVAALCFRTIEQLFIPPLDAAREQAEHDVAALKLRMEQLQVISDAVSVFRGVDTPQVMAATPQRMTASHLALSVQQPATEYVYILRSEHGPHKIGCTRDVRTRIDGLAGSLPFAVELAHIIQTDDMERLEQGLHAVYGAAGRRINGEWFHLFDSDVAYLISLGSEVVGGAIDTAIEGAIIIASTSALPPDLAVTLETKKRVAAEMRADHKSWREIANAVGRSPTTVREWLAVPASDSED